MSNEIEYKRLKTLETYFEKPLRMPLKDSKYLEFKIVYIKPSVMSRGGEEFNTLRMTVYITENNDFYPLYVQEQNGWVCHFMKFDESLRKMLGAGSGQPTYLNRVLQDYIERRVKYFGFNEVHINKIEFYED